MNDGFHKEEEILDMIKEWIFINKLDAESVFKSMDKDFDGIISKSDLKWSLVNIINMEEGKIESTTLDRLFRLMDLSKTNKIQPSDI